MDSDSTPDPTGLCLYPGAGSDSSQSVAVPAKLRVDPAKLAHWINTAVSILPSGHSGEAADVLVKKVIKELSKSWHPKVNWEEAAELLQEGRIIVWQADRKYRQDGGKGWSDFILWRLRKDLRKRLRKLRRLGKKDKEDALNRTRYPLNPNIEDRRGYHPDTLHAAFRPGCLVTKSADNHEDGDKEPEGGEPSSITSLPRSYLEDQLVVQDGQQRLLDRMFNGLSEVDRNTLEWAFGLNDNKEHTCEELGKRLAISDTTAFRRIRGAVANAREAILLSEHKLAALTGETTPDRQMAVLNCLEVLHQPPERWRTGCERGIKPIVVWLADVRYLLTPARIAHLDQKLTERLGGLMSIHVPRWLQEAHCIAVHTVSQALQCLSRLREGKFKLEGC